MRGRELAFYDAQASELDPAELPPRGPDAFEQSILDALGPVAGLRVLDAGCGSGDLTLELLRRGAWVTALDLSPAMVELVAARAEAFLPGRDLRVVAAPVEETALAAQSFDRVTGKWILHHVDVAAAARELYRVLTPGGTAVFFENQDRNVLLRLARPQLWRVPRACRVGTQDEHPLGRRDFRCLESTFGTIELRYPDFYFFEALSRALHYRAYRPLTRLDAALWRRLPALRPYSYHVLITLEKRPSRR